jgi:prefoldin subunit 5
MIFKNDNHFVLLEGISIVQKQLNELTMGVLYYEDTRNLRNLNQLRAELEKTISKLDSVKSVIDKVKADSDRDYNALFPKEAVSYKDKSKGL